jgi:hypothetical protein
MKDTNHTNGESSDTNSFCSSGEDEENSINKPLDHEE